MKSSDIKIKQLLIANRLGALPQTTDYRFNSCVNIAQVETKYKRLL